MGWILKRNWGNNLEIKEILSLFRKNLSIFICLPTYIFFFNCVRVLVTLAIQVHSNTITGITWMWARFMQGTDYIWFTLIPVYSFGNSKQKYKVFVRNHSPWLTLIWNLVPLIPQGCPDLCTVFQPLIFLCNWQKHLSVALWNRNFCHKGDVLYALYNTVATNLWWFLSPWKNTSASRELDCCFPFILIN